MSDDKLRISSQDLFTPQVEEYLETQAYLTREIGEVEPQSLFWRILFANWAYLAFWGMAGGLLGWVIIEPFFDEKDVEENKQVIVAGLLMFPMVAGGVGLFLGAAEGIMCRNIPRACLSGVIGLVVGFVGGVTAIIPAEIVFSIFAELSLKFSKNPQLDQMPTGMALLILMMGRALAWSIVSIPSGLGQGIATREGRVIINGLLGAVIGGFLGGLLFDPISIVLTSDDGQATYSRGVGFAVIGLTVGLLIGLVEGWTKTAWLLMKKGPLAGKQFILFKDTTVLGSSPKAEVYLFKDDAIEPRHVIIYNRGGRFEIEDCNTPDGTYVNGVPIKKSYLQHGDQIVLGKTVLEFALRDSNKS